MKEEILKLQQLMRDKGIDAYFVPSGDPHGSEYANDHYKTSEYLSGLLAENEELLVTADAAYIWTDGRFFLQADRELAGSGIQLMKMREPGVPDVTEFLRELISSRGADKFVLGFDGGTLPAGRGNSFAANLENCTLCWDYDLGGAVWGDKRPEIVPSKIWELDIKSAGMSASEKIALMRSEMAAKGADYLLLSDLTEPAWLTNLRGADILYTPVFFSYALIGMDEARLYVMDGALDNLCADSAANGTDILPESLKVMQVRKYEDIFSDISSLPEGSRLWIDSSTVNYALYQCIREPDLLIDEMTPAALAKTVKNDTEIACTRKAHIKDGVAVTEFIKWLKNESAAGHHLTEISAADYLESRRKAQDGCFDLSFETISGYGPNGAIIHYAVSPETNLEIRPEGFLLVDSGAQFTDGTTDITRTIAVGPLTNDMIDNYTRVLKGHIALSRAVITPDTTNNELDGLTRASLREAGLDYLHGVSHGVGHVLSVHEGPAGIRRNDEPNGLKAGMIMSNEPGVYIAGEYGIRIENELLLKEAGSGYPSGSLISEPITCAPYERDAVNVSMLTDEELEWINNYHAWVRETLLPFLDEETAAFLTEATQPFTR